MSEYVYHVWGMAALVSWEFMDYPGRGPSRQWGRSYRTTRELTVDEPQFIGYHGTLGIENRQNKLRIQQPRNYVSNFYVTP